MHNRGLAAATITATVIATAVAATGTATAAPAPVQVAHTKPAWTAHARHLGHAKESARVSARVFLAPRGGLPAAQRFATALSTPGSTQYGKFLTAQEYSARFAPTATTVQRVSSYLRSSGLHIGSVGADNRYVSVSGSAKAARKAFGVRIERYQRAGRTVQAPGANLRVPAALRSAVLTVSGLDTSPRRITPASRQTPKAFSPPAGFRNGKPCSLSYGAVKATYKADYKTKLPTFNGKTLPYAPCGYTGPQYRAAYEGNTALTGRGVTVAITDAYASNFIASDANRYAIAHGDGAYTPGQLYQTKPAKFTDGGPTECDASGWAGEETLDVEAIHAMAPGAKIHYYASASCSFDDFLDTLARVVDDNDSRLVSNSWGDVEANATSDAVAAYEAVFVQGAIQGQSFLFSSGDNGDEGAATGLKQADYPTSDPYVTSVGGTADAIGANGKFLFQTGWGTEKYGLTAGTPGKWTDAGYLYGAGGGSSSLFNRPAYQDGATTSGARQVPDVAMDADTNTGMLIGQTQTFTTKVQYDEFRIGGTSLASPLFAGLTALRLQPAAGKPVKGIGLLNPTIYKNAQSFTDISGTPPDAGVVRVDYVNGENPTGGLLYSVRTFNQDSTLVTKPGYDQVTGVGAGNSKWLTVGK